MGIFKKAQSLMYRPLQHDDSFRLLKMKRSPSGEAWKGTIVEERLSSDRCDTDVPKHVALSYVWGDPTVNFQSQDEDDLELNLSASTALEHLLILSSEAGVLNVWIDQICIEQGDDEEIKQQVSMMWRIYAAAQEVIGWLGPASEESDRTLNDIILFAVPRNKDPEEEERWLQMVKFRVGEMQPNDDPWGVLLSYFGQALHLGTDLRKRMIQLFNMPWFGRRWIAQEVCLASNLRIQWGYRSISGDQLFHAIGLIQRIVVPAVFPWLQKPFRNAFALLRTRNLVREAERGRSRISVAHVLTALGPLNCIEDQDRINALYGIFRRDNPWFSPEYCSTSELYINFAIGHIRHHRSLHILHFAGSTEPSRHVLEDREDTLSVQIAGPERDLPSWVPDWRIRQRPLLILPEGSDNVGLGGGSELFEVPFDPMHNTLTLRGKLLKTSIRPCGPPHFDRCQAKEDSRHQYSIDSWCNNIFVNFITKLEPSLAEEYRVSPTFTQWFESAGRDAESIHRLHSLVLCFARTLVMNCKVTSTEHFYCPPDRILEYFLEYAKLSLAADPDAASSAFAIIVDDPESMEKSAAYGYLAEHICRYRTLFVGDGGLVGLGSVGISPGDRICFFQGLATPFVVHADGDQFELRGECYLDGFMDVPFDDLEGVNREVVLK
jgi:hypothetical protein